MSGHTKTLMTKTGLFSERMVDLNHLTWLPAQEKGFTDFFFAKNASRHTGLLLFIKHSEKANRFGE